MDNDQDNRGEVLGVGVQLDHHWVLVGITHFQWGNNFLFIPPFDVDADLGSGYEYPP